MRTQAERRLEHRRRRESRPWIRRAGKNAAAHLRWFAIVVIALSLGAGMAALTRSWQAARDLEDARIERLLSALEASRPIPDRIDRQIDRWQRQEALDLQRRSQQTLGAYYQTQLEQDRIRDLLRVAVPHYPRQ